MSATTTTQTQSSAGPAAGTVSLAGLPKIKATIEYLDASIAKPYHRAHRNEGEDLTNVVHESISVDVTDLASTTLSEREAFGLNTHGAGFEIVHGFGQQETETGWSEEKWNDEEWIKQAYYKDVDQLLKDNLAQRGQHVQSTFIFDHTIRKGQTKHTPDDPFNRKPVAQAHCDQSRWSGENRIRKHLGDETLAKVKSGELAAQLINVWRPLRGPVEEDPLAVADSRTVGVHADGTSDWVQADLIFKDWTGQFLLIHKNPVHRWYYHSSLKTDQAILLKCYDSETETRTPHTAIVDPTSPKGAKPRWSMEVRVLVLLDPKASQ
ncbi:hypothetical protein IE81DRAFT_6044 [Ceraceosorus guamensis]|uniref:Uncharacterized protein n=1 Tax=Ceraceosorus guamensis TaxID=1522189 RepID=A0A316WCN1_9BASI|nr:hypothetical protein IE81DRAFT_6044 [Ceraceosorus guamensis]PWN46371.1 hypothetical protein IE81DRAFT_6044 [Ceraceosorus guamensis]